MFCRTGGMPLEEGRRFGIGWVTAAQVGVCVREMCAS